jgi:hypothetical protein
MIDHRPRAKCIPSDDTQFAAFVDAALGGLASESDLDLAASLQDRVRERYPDATIVAQDELAALSPWFEVLYAYRDGDQVNRVEQRWLTGSGPIAMSRGGR